ncbi:MAG TPA: cation-transporting P-type ATPase [Candidatus Saccharibacteria bacterium]|nr:cation-transporting P-type ATPase [Candidatus Saccharibacteria bacterium]HRQ06759.1 cation-transporting P-type ATPase [Candidatus Saccharibacteria bacterium]
MLYYNQSVRATLKSLDTSENGLSVTDAAERLTVHGLNSVKVVGEPLWRKLIEPFANVFMLVLLIAAAISFWHHSVIDGVIIVVIMMVSASIYYIQRFSTERILRSLQKHTAEQVSVMRDGEVVMLDSSVLVPGDIIILNEGDKVPADARLMDGNNIRTDESMLTGESTLIDKTVDAVRGNKEVYEQANILFQGSFIVSGEATAIVTETGNNTEFGKIAALAKNTAVTSPVQVKIDRLLSQIIIIVAGLAVVAFALAIIRGTELSEALRFVIAVAVSAVPESLPVAISIILVLGMRRMAKRKALVRNIRAIETVGVLTTIATDKTGTLTKNKLTVQGSWQPSGVHKLIDVFAFQSINISADSINDPLDNALQNYTNNLKDRLPGGTIIESIDFDQSYAMSGNVWEYNGKYSLIVKGAPEAIIDRSDLTDNEREKAELKLQQMTSLGYRVIAFGFTELKGPIDEFDDLPKRTKFEFVGYIGVADELRREAHSAIATALAAGVSVRMITGDHFETAYHIGKQLGMVTSREQVFDSRRMGTMSDMDLRETIKDVRVFSRVIPEDKYRILTLLKETDVTAMTGDGVNDVPALANAHVGVAMGNGSQIAKDAGDIILLDNNITSIIGAMKEGRIIFANIRRMLFYLLSTNAGEALTMVGALIIGMPIPLLPVQILWINLVTDTSMVIPLGLEPGEKNIMKRRPERPDAPILSGFILIRMIIIALSMAILAIVLYIVFSDLHDHDYARTIVFCALVVMQWANAFNARSDHESIFSRLKVWNGKFYIGLAIAIILQTLVLFGPLGGLLHITSVALGDLVITGVIAFIIPIVLVESHKFIVRRRLSI